MSQDPASHDPPPKVPVIELQDWLKLNQWVSSGGEAKVVIQGGEVRLNGEVETRRRKKLRSGDVIEFQGRTGTVGPIGPG